MQYLCIWSLAMPVHVLLHASLFWLILYLQQQAIWESQFPHYPMLKVINMPNIPNIVIHA